MQVYSEHLAHTLSARTDSILPTGPPSTAGLYVALSDPCTLFIRRDINLLTRIAVPDSLGKLTRYLCGRRLKAGRLSGFVNGGFQKGLEIELYTGMWAGQPPSNYVWITTVNQPATLTVAAVGIEYELALAVTIVGWTRTGSDAVCNESARPGIGSARHTLGI